jgi:hypothetical protein
VPLKNLQRILEVDMIAAHQVDFVRYHWVFADFPNFVLAEE